jgi:alcohol dehydrogenase
MTSYYEYYNPVRICSGSGALDNIPSILEDMNACAPLLLSDRTLEKIGTVKTVLKAVKPLKMAAEFFDIPADSSIAVVDRIAAIYRENECDSIIAIGGGSVIDTAKGVRLLISQNIENITELMGCEVIHRGSQVPFVAVPTTSGTGSEVTPVAVISNPQQRVKLEFISAHVLPDAAVLDERMTMTLPPRVTASTGIDALCHAIEAYTCMQKNPMSDAYAAKAMELIMQNLPRVIADPSNKAARLAMANASLMAGTSFGNSMVGLVHAIGHSLGGICHIAHGDAMSILLPYVMRYNLPKCEELYAQMYLYLAGAEKYAATPKEERAKEAIRLVRGLVLFCNRKCGLPKSLEETGKIIRGQFYQVAQAAVNDGAIIVNPVQAEVEDIVKILEMAY